MIKFAVIEVFEFRVKLSTKKEGLLWASEYGGSERTLFNFDSEKLSRYQWRGTGEWYWEMKKPQTDNMVLNRETLVLTWTPYGYGGDVFKQICELSTFEKLEAKMKMTAKDLDFEKAAILRDRIKKLRHRLVGK